MTPVRTSALRKGSPPPRRATPPTTPLADPRAAEEKRWPLQLMVAAQHLRCFQRGSRPPARLSCRPVGVARSSSACG